jgi:hypothetical protein
MLTNQTGEKAMVTATIIDKWKLLKVTVIDLQQQDAMDKVDEYLEYIKNLPEGQPLPVVKESDDGYISLQKDGLELRKEGFDIHDPAKPTEPGWYRVRTKKRTEILFWNGDWYSDEEQNHPRFGFDDYIKTFKVLNKLHTHLPIGTQVLITIWKEEDTPDRHVHLGARDEGEEDCYIGYEIEPETTEILATVAGFSISEEEGKDYSVDLHNGENGCLVAAKWVRMAPEGGTEV